MRLGESHMTKLRITIVAEYDANPKDYGSGDPEYMATIDKKSLDEQTMSIGEFLDGANTVDFKIEPA